MSVSVDIQEAQRLVEQFCIAANQADGELTDGAEKIAKLMELLRKVKRLYDDVKRSGQNGVVQLETLVKQLDRMRLTLAEIAQQFSDSEEFKQKTQGDEADQKVTQTIETGLAETLRNRAEALHDCNDLKRRLSAARDEKKNAEVNAERIRSSLEEIERGLKTLIGQTADKTVLELIEMLRQKLYDQRAAKRKLQAQSDKCKAYLEKLNGERQQLSTVLRQLLEQCVEIDGLLSKMNLKDRPTYGGPKPGSEAKQPQSSDFTQPLNWLLDRVQVLVSELRDLKQRRVKGHQEGQKAAIDLQQTRENLQRAKSRGDAFRRQTELLSKQMQDAKEACDRMAEKAQEHQTQLEHRIAQTRDAETDEKQVYDELVQDLARQSKAFDHELERNKADLVRLREQTPMLRERQKRLDEQKTVLEERLKTRNDVYEKRNNENDQELEEIQNQIKELQDTKEQLDIQKTTLIEKNREIKTQKESLNKEIEETKQQILKNAVDQDAEPTENDLLRQERQRLLDRLSKLQEMQRARHQRYRELSDRLAKISKEISNLKEDINRASQQRQTQPPDEPDDNNNNNDDDGDDKPPKPGGSGGRKSTGNGPGKPSSSSGGGAGYQSQSSRHSSSTVVERTSEVSTTTPNVATLQRESRRRSRKSLGGSNNDGTKPMDSVRKAEPKDDNNNNANMSDKNRKSYRKKKGGMDNDDDSQDDERNAGKGRDLRQVRISHREVLAETVDTNDGGSGQSEVADAAGSGPPRERRGSQVGVPTDPDKARKEAEQQQQTSAGSTIFRRISALFGGGNEDKPPVQDPSDAEERVSMSDKSAKSAKSAKTAKTAKTAESPAKSSAMTKTSSKTVESVKSYSKRVETAVVDDEQAELLAKTAKSPAKTADNTTPTRRRSSTKSLKTAKSPPEERVETADDQEELLAKTAKTADTTTPTTPTRRRPSKSSTKKPVDNDQLELSAKTAKSIDTVRRSSNRSLTKSLDTAKSLPEEMIDLGDDQDDLIVRIAKSPAKTANAADSTPSRLRSANKSSNAAVDDQDEFLAKTAKWYEKSTETTTTTTTTNNNDGQTRGRKSSSSTPKSGRKSIKDIPSTPDDNNNNIIEPEAKTAKSPPSDGRRNSQPETRRKSSRLRKETVEETREVREEQQRERRRSSSRKDDQRQQQQQQQKTPRKSTSDNNNNRADDRKKTPNKLDSGQSGSSRPSSSKSRKSKVDSETFQQRIVKKERSSKDSSDANSYTLQSASPPPAATATPILDTISNFLKRGLGGLTTELDAIASNANNNSKDADANVRTAKTTETAEVKGQKTPPVVDSSTGRRRRSSSRSKVTAIGVDRTTTTKSAQVKPPSPGKATTTAITQTVSGLPGATGGRQVIELTGSQVSELVASSEVRIVQTAGAPPATVSVNIDADIIIQPVGKSS